MKRRQFLVSSLLATAAISLGSNVIASSLVKHENTFADGGYFDQEIPNIVRNATIVLNSKSTLKGDIIDWEKCNIVVMDMESNNINAILSQSSLKDKNYKIAYLGTFKIDNVNIKNSVFSVKNTKISPFNDADLFSEFGKIDPNIRLRIKRIKVDNLTTRSTYNNGVILESVRFPNSDKLQRLTRIF